MLVRTHMVLISIAFSLGGCVSPSENKPRPPAECPNEKPWYRPKESVGGTYDRQKTEIKAPIIPPCRF
jgi:hypothetical protein